MITLNYERAALLDELATLEGQRPDLGGLVDEGARARLARCRAESAATQAARRRIAARIREGALHQDPEAADRVKRLGLPV